MIQVTVRIVQRSTRNSNSQMLVNEKNSMESNARLCTKTLAVVYFKKGLIPIVLKEGIKLSGLSRGVNRRSKEGRRKASSTVAAAFIPGVSEKTSTVNNGQPEEKSPQHQFIPGSAGAEFQNKIDIEKRSSIAGNMYTIKD